AAAADTRAAPRTPASWLPSAGQSQNVAPLPAGSHLQSEPQNELERTAPRPSSPGPCRFPTNAICCRIFIPALPDCPVASVVRDFCSGAHSSGQTCANDLVLLGLDLQRRRLGDAPAKVVTSENPILEFPITSYKVRRCSMSNRQRRMNGGSDVVCDHSARERESAAGYGSRRQPDQRSADDRGSIRERKHHLRAEPTRPDAGNLTVCIRQRPASR